jgi:pyruvate dehydrogenase E2 component (dihydrolipoamide acetyltransferase)
MAKFEFKLPDIGEGVTEGEIVNWLAEVGDVVAENQDIVEVMTDKATVTIGAPRAGVIAELRGNPGDVVPVGGVLVVFDLDEGSEPREDQAPVSSPVPAALAEPAPLPRAEAQDAEDSALAVGDLKEVLPGTSPQDTARLRMGQPAADAYFNDQPLAAPAVRKFARELGVDLRHVEPSGKGGRITREDVRRFVDGAAAAPAAVPVHEAVTMQPTSAPGFAAPGAGAPPEMIAEQPAEERIAIRGLRRRIFENMARAKRTAAHFTYVDECEVSRLRELRERAQAEAERNHVRLTFLPFIIKAVVAALKLHPQLNAVMDDERHEIVRRRSYHIGIGVATDAGLIAPVLRHADRRSILEIAVELERLGQAAREGKIRPEDLGGSSFTITSLGKLGGLFATPVVNYPEVAILGVHEMRRRPLVRGDQIVVGEVMLLSVSFDHRIIDGHVGAAFAQELIGYLEQPERLIVSMC